MNAQQVELWMGRCVAVLDLPVVAERGDRIHQGDHEYEVLSRTLSRPDPSKSWTVRLHVKNAAT